MANEKISQYVNEVVTLADTDLFDVSDDLGGGSFESKRLTWANLRSQVDNLYNIDGTLAAARQVDQDSNTLGFINGKIGIGVAVPTLGRLQIDGEGTTQATKAIHARDSGAQTTHILYDDGSSFHTSGISVGLNAPGSNIGFEATGGNFQFGFRSNTVTTGVDNYGFYSQVIEANVGFDNIGAYLTADNADNNYALLVDQGDVGMGVLAPTEKLHLVGNFRYVDGNEGAGKVLVSDATGIGTWTTFAGDGNGIYDGDGTFAADATVTMNSFDLILSGGFLYVTNTDNGTNSGFRIRKSGGTANRFAMFMGDGTGGFNDEQLYSVVNNSRVWWRNTGGNNLVEFNLSSTASSRYVSIGDTVPANAILNVKGRTADDTASVLSLVDSADANLFRMLNNGDVAFFGGTPAGQVADSVALTDSTGGTADNTVAAVSGSGDDATINNNFADLTAKYNALRDFARAHGLMA